MLERTYRISDVVNDSFLRFPMSLLANPKYKQMSLEAKFIYSLLLNRLTLSQKNGWINEDGEVYLIYTREDAADMLNISYKKTITAFRELIDNGLLYEKRQGRGYPNLLYVLKAELNDANAADFADKYDDIPENSEPEDAGNPQETQIFRNGSSRPADLTVLDMSKRQFLTCQNSTSRPAGTEVQDMPKQHPKKIKNINNNLSYPENSQSVRPAHTHGAGHDGLEDNDNETLKEIFDRCELTLFQPNIRAMICNAIERLYYSDSLKIGNARLPRDKVRSYLHLLDAESVMNAIESMKQNEQRVVNPTAYLMSTLFNSICEKDSGLILSLPPEYVGMEDLYIPAATYGEEVEKDAPE